MSKIEIIRGDDITLNMTFTNDDGSALNLTGSTVFFTVTADNTKANDNNAIITKDISVHTTPLGGLTTIQLSDTETSVAVGDYKYDFQLRDSGNKIKSTRTGTFSVLQDTTKRII